MESERKGMVEWLLKIGYKESMVSDIGRACRCEKFGLMELVDLLWLQNFVMSE